MDNNVKFTLSDAVKRILVNYPYMNEFLMEECVNYSALARKLTPKLLELLKKDKIKQEAVTMSIIRYVKSLKTTKLSQEIIRIVASSSITLKTDMMYFIIPRNEHNQKTLELFHSKVEWKKNQIFFMVQGINDISIVVDRSNYEKLYKTLIDVDLQYPSTAILILHSPPEASGPGVIHYLTAPIAKAGIAIEMHTLKQDTIFLVDEKNSSEVFSILKKIIDRCR